MYLICANAAEDTLSVIDIETFTKVGDIELNLPLHSGKIGPRRLLPLEDRVVLCSNSYDATVSMIDLASGQEKQALTVGAYPTALCKDLYGAKVCCGEADSIWSIDTINFAVLSCAPSGRFPNGIISLDDGYDLAVSNMLDCNIIVMDAADMRILDSATMEGSPLCIANSGDRLFVANTANEVNGYGKLCMYTTDTLEKLRCVDIPGMPGMLLPVHTEKKLLLITSSSIGLRVIDSDTFEMIKMIDIQGMPDDIVYYKGNIFVSDMIDDEVQVFDMKLKKIRSIKTGGEPRGLAIMEL